MTANAGNHQHEYKGAKGYCNVDSSGCGAESETAAKEKAVRKVVRAIIEADGSDGKAVKHKINARYKKDVVMWEDAMVAEWKNGKMELVGAGTGLREAFEKLMAP